MINRVFVFVIDGFGVGPLPDALDYGDADVHSLAHLADTVGGLDLPNLEMLGLGHVAQIAGVRPMDQVTGCFGRLGFTSRGNDSVSGYWEMNGVVALHREGAYRTGIPDRVISVIEQTFGRKVIGQRMASMETMLREYGTEHVSSGAPILWTDGGSTCYIAAHDSVMAAPVLHQRCRDAWREAKKGEALIRIVAQPVSGEPASLRAHVGRKDFVTEPPAVTMLDVLNRSSQITMGIGKVADLFSGRGFTRAFPVESAMAAFDETVGMLNKVPRGLLYVSLNLFPEQPEPAAAALQEFDRRLPALIDKLRAGDLVILTGDHGRDLSKPDKLPTREFVPLLVTGPNLAHGVDLGDRDSAADLGQTVAEALRAERLPVGESFGDALRLG
ncbi:MAG: phosphopentomutase [Nitrospira sp.]|nr:phosphopentomutase [Nitrospira sp.]